MIRKVRQLFSFFPFFHVQHSNRFNSVGVFKWKTWIFFLFLLFTCGNLSPQQRTFHIILCHRCRRRRYFHHTSILRFVCVCSWNRAAQEHIWLETEEFWLANSYAQAYILSQIFGKFNLQFTYTCCFFGRVSLMYLFFLLEEHNSNVWVTFISRQPRAHV